MHVNTSTKHHPDPPKHCLEKPWLTGGLPCPRCLAPQQKWELFPACRGQSSSRARGCKGHPQQGLGKAGIAGEALPRLGHLSLPSPGEQRGKERRCRGCHGSGSMGSWQESKKYSLQAYLCGFVTKKICENSWNKFAITLSKISVLWSHRNTQVPAHWQGATLLWAVSLCGDQWGYKVLSKKTLNITVWMCSLLFKPEKLPEEESSSKEQCGPGSWQKSPSLIQNGDFAALHRHPWGIPPMAPWFCHLKLSGYFQGHLGKVTPPCSSWATGKVLCKLPRAPGAAGSRVPFGNTHQEMVQSNRRWGQLHVSMRCCCRGAPGGMLKSQCK